MRLSYDYVSESLDSLMIILERKTGVNWYKKHYTSNGCSELGVYGISKNAGIYIGVQALDDTKQNTRPFQVLCKLKKPI